MNTKLLGTARHESTYIVLFLTRYSESINDPVMSLCLTHSIFVLLMTSKSIDDDVTVTRQFSLDNDFIHGDIHGRSYKKQQ